MVLTEDRSLQELKLMSSALNFEKVRSNFEPGAAAGLSSNSGFLSDP
jgi:hypothetical protein